MNDRLKQALLEIKYENGPELASNTWKSICLKKDRKEKLQLWIFSFIGILSLALLVPMLKVLWSNLVQSGFSEYLSLAFEGSVFSYFKEFILTLAESLPIVSITLSLSLIFMFLLSIKYTMKNIIRKSYAF